MATITPDQLALYQNLANYGYAAPQYLPSEGGYTTVPDSSGPFGVNLLDSVAKHALPTAANMFNIDGTTGEIMNYLDPLNSILPGSGFISNKLFGKKTKQVWQPFLGPDGKYYWTSPNTANPVPLSDIPGASIQPTPEYQALANQIRSVQDLLPYYSQAISAQKIPDAMGQLAADTATTGPRLALQQSLQEQYGPIFDRLAAESNLRRSSYSAANDASVLAGPGQELIKQALAAAKLYDPEYFSSRAATSDAVNKLLANTSANLDSGLTNTERDEVGKGLAIENMRRGVGSTTPSQFDTISNAMQYGAAGRAKQVENQNQLSKAIAASTAFLPTSKSNVDVFQVATGRPSATMDNRFNTNTAGQDASASAQGLLNTGASFWTTNTNNAAQKALQDDQQNDWGVRLGQITSAAGTVGKLFGMCWVAREVYGASNPRWLKFRDWVIMKSPDWFYNWYAKNGEEFANYIKDKPLLKRIIRWWMDTKIKE